MGAVVGAQDNAVSDHLNGSFLKWPRAGRSRPAQGGRRIGRSEQRRYDRLLMIASQNGHEQVVRVLLEAGADRNPNSNCGVMCCASVDVKNAIFIA